MRSPELCKFAGISYRQLDYWCRSGLLGPDYEKAQQGKGYEREFSLDMAKKLAVTARLIAVGFETKVAIKIGLSGASLICLGDGLTLRIEPVHG